MWSEGGWVRVLNNPPNPPCQGGVYMFTDSPAVAASLAGGWRGRFRRKEA